MSRTTAQLTVIWIIGASVNMFSSLRAGYPSWVFIIDGLMAGFSLWLGYTLGTATRRRK